MKGAELETLPPKATFFRVKRKTVNAVQLSWKFEDKNPYNLHNQYVVELETGGGNWEEVFCTDQDYCMIKELTPDTVYVLQIHAKNSKGIGPNKRIKVKTKKVPNQWNGGAGKGFYWMQSTAEITVVVPIPDTVKSKDIEIKLDNRLLIRVKDIVVIDGILWFDYDEYLWEIDRSNNELPVIILSIEKKDEDEAWPWPVKGVDQIETQLVDFQQKADPPSVDANAPTEI